MISAPVVRNAVLRTIRIGLAAHRSLALLLLLLISAKSLAAADNPQAHMVPMRDGIRLATDVYLPAGVEGPVPAVFARGPYGKALGSLVAPKVTRNGYAFVIQDMRGRFASEGNDAVVFHNDGWSERRDGQDAITWIARQDWCDGKVATWGGSALGITQNLLAPGAPAALKAQFVQVAFSDMYSQAAYQGGVWRKSLMEPWLSAHKFDPLSLQTFLEHPRYDAFWMRANAETQVARVNAPAIFQGGWYDIFLQGTINSFTTIQQHGGDGARGKCRLILGPWAHGSFQELKYPPNSDKHPVAANPFRFFDHLLRDVDNGVTQDLPVHYYVMGDPTDPRAPGNHWRSADTWPPPSTPTAFYFQQDGRLTRQSPTNGNDGLTYRYDPLDPVPTIGGQNLSLPKGPMDQRALDARKDILRFTSPILTRPLEVTGRIRATLFVTSDCPDTDFTVKLCDVYPDGRSMIVCDGILRARYRNSFKEETLLEPGRTYEIEVDLWSTSLIFNTGHQLRVDVSSSNAPRFEPNPNTGHPFRADTETRVATNTLHLSAQHPSHILLPVYSASAGQ